MESNLMKTPVLTKSTSDNIYFVLDLNDELKTYHINDEIFKSCETAYVKLKKCEVEDSLIFELDEETKFCEIKFRGTTMQECAKYIKKAQKNTRSEDDDEDVSTINNKKIDSNAVLKLQDDVKTLQENFKSMHHDVNHVLENQSLILRTLNDLRNGFSNNTKSPQSRTKNQKLTSVIQLKNGKKLAKTTEEELIALINENQRNFPEITINGTNICSELKKTVKLFDCFADASLCGTKVAAFLAPKEFYKNALLRTVQNRGFARRRAYGPIKKIFNVEFCKVFYDSLKYLAGCAIADEVELNEWLAEARNGLHQKGNQMATNGRYLWPEYENHTQKYLVFEEITEEYVKNSDRVEETPQEEE